MRGERVATVEQRWRAVARCRRCAKQRCHGRNFIADGTSTTACSTSTVEVRPQPLPVSRLLLLLLVLLLLLLLRWELVSVTRLSVTHKAVARLSVERGSKRTLCAVVRRLDRARTTSLQSERGNKRSRDCRWPCARELSLLFLRAKRVGCAIVLLRSQQHQPRPRLCWSLSSRRSRTAAKACSTRSCSCTGVERQCRSSMPTCCDQHTASWAAGSCRRLTASLL